MKVAYDTMRARLETIVEANLKDMPAKLKELLVDWQENKNNGDRTRELSPLIVAELEKVNKPYAKEFRIKRLFRESITMDLWWRWLGL